MKKLLIATAAIALLASAPAFANNCTPGNNNNNGNNNAGQRFVNQAANHNLANIRLGELAAQKASKPEVKEFGRWIAADGRTLNKTLVSLCQLENFYPRPEESTGSTMLKAELNSAKNKKFDQQFLKSVEDISASSIRMYRNEANNNNNNGNAPALHYYARDAMPILQAHLVEAQRLQGKKITPAAALPATGSSAVAPAATGAGSLTPQNGNGNGNGNGNH